MSKGQGASLKGLSMAKFGTIMSIKMTVKDYQLNKIETMNLH